MRIIFLSLAFLCFTIVAFSQRFMHGVGLAGTMGTSKQDFIVGAGLTYSPRINIIQNDALSVSVGIPVTVTLTSYSPKDPGTTYYQGANGHELNAPLIINLSLGRGSTRDNSNKFGYFIGGGGGYHYIYTRSDMVNLSGMSFTSTDNSSLLGWAVNAGLRVGIGESHKNLELRLSYMKTIQDYHNNMIFGGAVLFNF